MWSEKEYIAKVYDGGLFIKERKQFLEDLNEMYGEVVLTIKRRRSKNQNDYYRAILRQMLQSETFGGRTMDELHEELKQVFKIKTTKTLSVDEFTDYMDRIIRWAGSIFQIGIKDPNSEDS